MKVGLNVADRALLISILPPEGSLFKMRMVRDLKLRLGFTAEDFQKFGIKTEGDKTSWNEEGLIEIEFDFQDAELEIIRKQLGKKNSEQKLTLELLPVYDKFCT